MMKKIDWNVENPPLVWVKWVDARGLQANWFWSRSRKLDHPDYCLIEIETAGWLVLDAEDRIVVVANKAALLDEDNDLNMAGGSVIPKQCIIELQEIE